MFTIFQNKNILLPGPARNLKNRICNVSTLCPMQLIHRSYYIFILVKLNFSSVITITILCSVMTFCFVSFFLSAYFNDSLGKNFKWPFPLLLFLEGYRIPYFFKRRK